MPLGNSLPAQRNEGEEQENNSSRHNSVTAAVSNVQTTSYRKPRPKSKTSDISKQSPSPLHHTFLLRRARFTAQPLSALASSVQNVSYCKPLHNKSRCLNTMKSFLAFKVISTWIFVYFQKGFTMKLWQNTQFTTANFVLLYIHRLAR